MTNPSDAPGAPARIAVLDYLRGRDATLAETVRREEEIDEKLRRRAASAPYLRDLLDPIDRVLLRERRGLGLPKRVSEYRVADPSSYAATARPRIGRFARPGSAALPRGSTWRRSWLRSIPTSARAWRRRAIPDG